MKIGILGGGHIGGTLTQLWAEAGHQVMVSSRHPEELESLVSEIDGDAQTGSVDEAAAFGEVVFLAIPLKGVVDTLPVIEDDLSGKVVIDAMNPFPGRDGEVAQEIFDRDIASGVRTQERLPDAKVARAFSSVYYQVLRSEAHREDKKIAVPIAADDDEARSVTEQLVKDAGFEPFDLGSLAESKPLDPEGRLFTESMTATEMKKALG